MSLYPSLEDMMVHADSLAVQAAPQAAVAQPAIGAVSVAQQLPSYPSLYPSLNDMGLDISPELLHEHSLAVAQFNQNTAVARPVAPATQSMVAPVSGPSEMGMMRAEIKQGIRPVVICKDTRGKVGLGLTSISKGVFVAFVYRDSPASLAGLRFGDQLLQINGTTLAGFKTSQVTKLLAKAAPENIAVAVRDRPFERTVTMQKDSLNHVGFVFKKGHITSIVKDSSAARNGLLIDHYIVEVNGQNVVGLSDADIAAIFAASPLTVTITIMPDFLYNHLVKHIGSMKKYMDHTVPEV